jgi:hypothetical protein
MTFVSNETRPVGGRNPEDLAGCEAGFEWAQSALAHNSDHPEVRAVAELSGGCWFNIQPLPPAMPLLENELFDHGRTQLDAHDPWSEGFVEGVAAGWFWDAE